MLVFFDYLLTFIHFGIVSFNLFGWIPPITRKAHLISILITAGSWFVLGIWFGIGYCPVTDWQWEVKEKLGEKNLPASFITYYAERLTGYDFSPSFINIVTVAGFVFAVLATVYVNFIMKKRRTL